MPRSRIKWEDAVIEWHANTVSRGLALWSPCSLPNHIATPAHGILPNSPSGWQNSPQPSNNADIFASASHPARHHHGKLLATRQLRTDVHPGLNARGACWRSFSMMTERVLGDKSRGDGNKREAPGSASLACVRPLALSSPLTMLNATPAFFQKCSGPLPF